MTRKRWLATGLVAGWAAVLVGLAVWAAHQGPETVRAHSDLAAGRASLDRAVEILRAEAGPVATVEVGPYQVDSGCRITFARRGTEVDRELLVTVPPGQEPAVLERLADRVPAEWGARVSPVTGRLRADAGDFVAVTGELAEPGQVLVTVSTGCRPGEDPALPDQ